VEANINKSLDVVAIVGSLRAGSLTRRVVIALAGIMRDTLTIEIVEIGSLPLYNQDGETAPSAAWSEFRARIKRADAVLFATPEYNRSVPGGLKNAIDVGSRPNAAAGGVHRPRRQFPRRRRSG
jgi:chromate reductase